jgi:hypothetical protein
MCRRIPARFPERNSYRKDILTHATMRARTGEPRALRVACYCACGDYRHSSAAGKHCAHDSDRSQFGELGVHKRRKRIPDRAQGSDGFL